MSIKVFTDLQILFELKTIKKPVSYQNMNYPLNGLTDNEFENLLYQLFKKRIENNKYQGKIDRVDLMAGVGEKGRDCLLTYQGMNIGLVVSAA